MLTRRAVPVLVAVAAAASVAGCGGGSESASETQVIATGHGTSPSGSGTTPSGPVTSADGAFHTIVPEGFVYTPPPSTKPGNAAVEYAASRTADNDFRSITVSRQGLEGKRPTAAIEAIVAGIRKAPGVGHATALKDAPSPPRARTWQFRSAPNGAPAEIVQQTFVGHGDALYIVTATAPAEHLAELEQSTASMLAAWQWA